jgi:hypothetical protein
MEAILVSLLDLLAIKACCQCFLSTHHQAATRDKIFMGCGSISPMMPHFSHLFEENHFVLPWNFPAFAVSSF